MTATDRSTFLAARRKFIGSSDAGPACGISPWNTAYGVYCSKVYGIEKPETNEMRIGTLIEPFIASIYTHETGRLLTRPGAPFVHPDRPWQGANCDYIDDKDESVEIKNVSGFHAREFGEGGTDSIPAWYTMQAQHQLEVRQKEQGFLAALIGGTDFRVYTITRNDELVKLMNQAEEALWGMIENLTPPEPDFKHPSTAELMKVLAVPSADVLPVTGTVEHFHLAQEYVHLGKQVSTLEASRKAIKAELMAAMDRSSVMSLPDGSFIRRRLIQRAGFTVEPTSYHDFRITTK